MPTAPEARFFYRAAQQRLEDAQVLLAGGRTTGAVYMAGYAVECMLKALLLAQSADRARKMLLRSFRGVKAHDFESLKLRYSRIGGARFPGGVTRAFSVVSTWKTDFRYKATMVDRREAETFLRSVQAIFDFADRRL